MKQWKKKSSLKYKGIKGITRSNERFKIFDKVLFVKSCLIPYLAICPNGNWNAHTLGYDLIFQFSDKFTVEIHYCYNFYGIIKYPRMQYNTAEGIQINFYISFLFD